MFLINAFAIIVVIVKFEEAHCKYIEGEINTSDNWAFLTRFCFLSQEGQFDYLIEFNEEHGYPNLLLYYDTDAQWPAVYKSNKTCYGKENVLNIQQNQIVNLTMLFEKYQNYGGCTVAQTSTTSRTSTTSTTVPTTTSTTESTTTSTTESTTTSTTESNTTSTTEWTTTSTTKSNTTSTASSTITSTPNITTTTAILSSDAITKRSTPTLLTTVAVSTSTMSFPVTKSKQPATKGGSRNFTEVFGEQFDSENIYEEDNTLRFTTITKSPIRKRHISFENFPSSNRVIICQNSRRFQSSRERWWFIAVSNCNSTKGIHIKYKILMTNGPPGDYFHEHFSADQFYILPILITYSVGYSLLLLAILICTVELKSRQLLHSTYKLFVLSVIIQFFSVILQTAAYLKYAVNGIGAPTAKTFGNIMMCCSETCFLLLLLLLAKGYTVTRGRLRLASSVKLTIFMCAYSVTYICIFVYEAHVFDPGEVLYLYESPAGYALIILRIIAWVMFVYSTVFTLKHYPEKSIFYYPFNICGTLWFIAGPAFILSANTYIDKWVRESVVCGVLLLITFCGHLMFLTLTMPSMANKNFPYHVRTSQIGIMEITGTAGVSTIERFGHHVYEPTPEINDERVIIPLTRRTEEIFGGIYGQHIESNFVRNMHLQTNTELPEEILSSQSITMQNVLSWSLAKNYAAFDISRTDRLSQRSTESHHSQGSPTSTTTIQTNSNQEVVENGVKRETYEYVKDVPVELFTVSKPARKNSDSEK